MRNSIMAPSSFRKPSQCWTRTMSARYPRVSWNKSTSHTPKRSELYWKASLKLWGGGWCKVEFLWWTSEKQVLRSARDGNFVAENSASPAREAASRVSTSEILLDL